MSVAVFFGLVSALGYGFTDYLARPAGRATGVWRSLFYGELFAFIALSIWLLFKPPVFDGSFADLKSAWAATAAAGIILLASAAALTRGFIHGTTAVVAPVAASYGAISALLSAVSGEHLSVRAELGIGVTLVGVCLVSIPPAGGSNSSQPHSSASGLGWAAAGAIGYGVGFWLQGQFAVEKLGPFIPVWLSYGMAMLLIPLCSPALKISLALPKRSALLLVLGCGAFSAVGYLAVTAGFATGYLAVVVVLSSLSSAITVLLARLLDHAPVARHQWLAIAVIVAGLVLIRS